MAFLNSHGGKGAAIFKYSLYGGKAVRKKTSDIDDIPSEIKELLDVLVEIALEEISAAETKTNKLTVKIYEDRSLCEIFDGSAKEDIRR